MNIPPAEGRCLASSAIENAVKTLALRAREKDVEIACHISPDLADEAARMLVAVTLGIAVLARSRPDRALLESAARPALASLTIQLNHNERGMG